MTLLKKYFNKIIINNANKEIYCLKIDVSKYFYSIDHNILLNMLKKRIKDIDVIRLINIIISETNSDYINKNITKYNNMYNTDIPYYKENIGLSIGAMSSQFLAIYFLNDLDHYIKENLNCKYYIRYMDDLLILYIDKDKLKEIYKIISKKLEKKNLKVNKKSNLYKSSKGFSFLGYFYKVINNKLYISCKKDTAIRIKKKLFYLKNNDKLRYIKVFASCNGYFKPVYNIERSKYTMVSNSRKMYDIYKDNYSKAIVIVKEGIFYKTYSKDAKIMWYLFSYKYSNDNVSFGNNSYDKVILKLKQSNISFVIVDKEKKLLSYFSDELFYDSYFNLSSKSYKKYQSNVIYDNNFFLKM